MATRATAHNNIGNAYYCGNGVEMNKKKAQHHYELAAMEVLLRQGTI